MLKQPPVLPIQVEWDGGVQRNEVEVANLRPLHFPYVSRQRWLRTVTRIHQPTASICAPINWFGLEDLPCLVLPDPWLMVGFEFRLPLDACLVDISLELMTFAVLVHNKNSHALT